MKKRLIMLIFMLLCVISFSYAQTCKNKSNATIGKIESNGTVRNASNVKIGSFDNNVIRNASNTKVGSIDGRTIKDKNGRKLARLIVMVQ
ncbi:MAG: hypothetical protein Q4A54_04175 [Parabacteroides sp.]|nr:hypothetical protein [Parabacteroides sp.]